MPDSDSSFELCATSPQLIKSHSTPSSAAYTVHDAIETIGFGRFQLIMSLLSGFAFIADSMEIMLLSLLTPSLACEWGITPAEQALCTTCVFIGWMVGSPVWGWLCDRYGRRTGVFVSALMCAIFGIATAASTGFPMFVVLRDTPPLTNYADRFVEKIPMKFVGCVGLALGGTTQLATLYTEFLPTTKRASCMLILQVFWSIGAVIEAVTALIVMPALGWRGLVVCSSLPLLIFAFCCIWLPESARYYVAQGEKNKAKTVLERMARYNKKALPEGDLVSEKIEQDEEDKKTLSGMLSLFAKPLIVTTLLLWLVWMINTFSFYGLILYTTMLFQSTDVCHGGSEDNAYSNDTALCIPLKHEDYVDMIKTSCAELPGLIISFLLIERIGRKRTMSIQFLLFGIANYLLFFCMDRSLLIAILFAARAFIAGAFQATFVYTPEVYPTPIRALGIGTASAFGRIGAMITPYVAQVIASFNPVYASLIYGTCGLVGALSAFFLPIETAGRQMMD